MSNRRKLRSQRRKHPHYNRGGGVVSTSNPYGGPMNVLDGGHDAPVGPDSPRSRALAWSVLGLTVLVAVVAIGFKLF